MSSLENGPVPPCPECGSGGECAHRVSYETGVRIAAAARERRKRKNDEDRRATIEAACEWVDARDQADRAHRTPTAVVAKARELASPRTANPYVSGALERIAKLEAAKAAALESLAERAAGLARTLPSRSEWDAFFTEVIATAANWRGPVHWCSCGHPFVATGRREHCSDNCSARERMRGRGTSKARASTAAKALRKHVETCPVCKAGKDCARVGLIMERAPSTDALSRVSWDDLGPDAADGPRRRKPKP